MASDRFREPRKDWNTFLWIWNAQSGFASGKRPDKANFDKLFVHFFSRLSAAQSGVPEIQPGSADWEKLVAQAKEVGVVGALAEPVRSFALGLLGECAGGCVLDPLAGVDTPLSILADDRSVEWLAFAKSQSAIALGQRRWPAFQWYQPPGEDLAETIGAWNRAFRAILTVGTASLREQEGVGPSGGAKSDVAAKLIASCVKRLEEGGRGIFLLTREQVLGVRSVVRSALDIGVRFEGLFALPANGWREGPAAEYWLCSARRGSGTRTFVAQLASDPRFNEQILSNFRNSQPGSSIDAGRFTDAARFEGFRALELRELLKPFEQAGYRLEELKDLCVPEHGAEGAELSCVERSCGDILVPNRAFSLVKTIGRLDSPDAAWTSAERFKIDPARAMSMAIKAFLEGDVGTLAREVAAERAGLGFGSLREMLCAIRIPLPSQEVQEELVESRSVLQELGEDLETLGRDMQLLAEQIYSEPIESVRVRKEQLRDNLEQMGWHSGEPVHLRETWWAGLPYPMAAIVRKWRARAREDSRGQHEDLRNFFEAAAQFHACVLISGFSRSGNLGIEVRGKLARALDGVDPHRISFGTWVAIIECLGAEVRAMLGNEHEPLEARRLIQDWFADSKCRIAQLCASVELVKVLHDARKLRNDAAHRGEVDVDAYRRWNDELERLLDRYRHAIGKGWRQVRLFAADSSSRAGKVRTVDMRLMMGSSQHFINEKCELDYEPSRDRLYLLADGSKRPLELEPIVRLVRGESGQSPIFAYLNRVERGSDPQRKLSFVSYECPWEQQAVMPDILRVWEDWIDCSGHQGKILE